MYVQLADLDYLEDRERELDSRRKELLSATLSKLEKATEVRRLLYDSKTNAAVVLGEIMFCLSQVIRRVNKRRKSQVRPSNSRTYNVF